MMAYDHAFTPSPSWKTEWEPLDIKPSVLIEALYVFSWFGMVAFAVGMLLAFATGGDIYAGVGAFAGLFWMACAISIIRMRKRLAREILIAD